MNSGIEKNKKGIFLMVISSICVCLGQLFWKLSAIRGWQLLFLGFFLYGIGAIIMIIAYRYGELSVLQPMLSLNYVFSIILAAVVLNENISFLRVIGILIIIYGVIMIAKGD